MKMKKRNKIICILLSMLLVFSFAACGDEPTLDDSSPTTSVEDGVKLEFESTWSYDDVAHYKSCTDKTKKDVIDYNEHYYSEETTDENGYYCKTCIICGYEKYRNQIEGKFTATISNVSEDGLVYPYVEAAKRYLSSPRGIDNLVGTDCRGILEPSAPIVVAFTSDENVREFKVTYSTSVDYSNGFTYVIDKNERSYGIYNTLPNTKYYVKVEEVLNSGEVKSLPLEFTTANIATRTIYVEGLMNVRDLGGYVTSIDGKSAIKYGKIYRGSSFKSTRFSLNLTENGLNTLTNVLGIKTEVELRQTFEIQQDLANEYVPVTSSVISGAQYLHIPVEIYENAFVSATTKANYKALFEALSVESNYPFYIHCHAGAKHTDTAAFLISALLGASEEDLKRDFDMVSYSAYGAHGADADQNYSVHFIEIYNRLKACGAEGDSLAVCAQKYALSIGVSQSVIDRIREINLG